MPIARHGHSGQAHRAGLALAEWLCRTADWVDSECVDHFIVLGETHLRRILRSYARYYNDVRTHRSLNKDAPVSRPVQRTGTICLLYTSDAADEEDSVDLGGRRII